jgi:hypothetical protein
MFEFHGWINICPDESDDANIEVLDDRQRLLTNEVEQRTKDIAWCNGVFTVHRGLNGEDHLVLTGCANHRQPQVIELFSWVASRQPHSYGLLHIRDDEDCARGHDNEFRVFALARGTLTEATEPLLSPCIPKIEEPME